MYFEKVKEKKMSIENVIDIKLSLQIKSKIAVCNGINYLKFIMDKRILHMDIFIHPVSDSWS